MKSQTTTFRLTTYRAVVFALLTAGILAGAGAQTWKCRATTVTLKNGTLRISGKGAMADEGFPPWSRDSSITGLIIDDGVTHIGEYAFFELKSIKTATIPRSVTSIGKNAFRRCGLTSITVPSSVTSIGEGTFEECMQLTSATISGSVKSISKKAFSSSNLKSIIIQSGVESIGEKAFYMCDSLTSVIIPESVKTIETDAFNTSYYSNNITSITIPEGVKYIGDCAFCGWYKLTSITIPASVTYCNGAFGGAGLTSINVHINNPVYISVGGVLFNKAQDTLIKYPRGKQGASYTIPKRVTTIGEGAFAPCSGLTSIVISNNVTTIGESAFAGSGLTSITIPNSVTTIGKGAFAYCAGLTSVVIPSSVTTIEEKTFEACKKLTSIVIPGSVTIIGDETFADCESLKSVVIPGSVTTIGRAAFTGCDGITSITSLNPAPPVIDVGNEIHYRDGGLPTDAVIYVLASAVNAYKQAPGWKGFRKILSVKK